MRKKKERRIEITVDGQIFVDEIADYVFTQKERERSYVYAKNNNANGSAADHSPWMFPEGGICTRIYHD
jgi:hypothetical protein